MQPKLYKFKYLLLLTTLLFPLIGQSQQIEKPNILFISVDDLKPSIGSFGDEFAVTPNIDELSKDASVFLNNQNQLAICTIV